MSRHRLLRRRLIILGVAGPIAPAMAAPATDSDPRDQPGRGRIRPPNSDTDPSDPPGRGRTARSPSATPRTDIDPRDQAGRGRAARTGASDSDARDRPGEGRALRPPPIPGR